MIKCERCKESFIGTTYQNERGYGRCKICSRAYYHSHKKHTHAHKSAKRREVVKKYGLSLEDYYTMWNNQKGLCSLCNSPETEIRNSVKMWLSVDHDHITGQVRGLLCNNCNKNVGVVEKWGVLIGNYLTNYPGLPKI